MGWAEKRIEEYKQGRKANWVERRIIEHANLLNFALSLIAAAFLMYGFWLHDRVLIGSAVAIAILGHLYCSVKK